jgi:uncharacterized membrane protein YsdA (DUF1294 family)
MLINIFWGYIILANIAAFASMGIDKKRATNKVWRISERNLFFYAFIGGAVGSWCGMRGYNHKTNKDKFRIGMPLMILWNVVFVYLMFKFVI